jgi:tRNA nucleotidyltransferase (CCA-adding enzyme)
MTVYVTWFFLLLLSTTVNPYMITELRSFPRTSYYSRSLLGASAARKEEKKASSEPFNVVLTHCTADFDSLASACGLAKLWSTPRGQGSLKDYDDEDNTSSDNHYSTPREYLPTYVVLPRGAHPGVSKFLSLHKHLFPIRALRNLPDLEGLERLGLVDAQRLERIGPASPLVSKAKHITVVDHHVDGETDIENVKVSRYEE